MSIGIYMFILQYVVTYVINSPIWCYMMIITYILISVQQFKKTFEKY